jgi:tetratricopeptide (TPR) repeat protein
MGREDEARGAARIVSGDIGNVPPRRSRDPRKWSRIVRQRSFLPPAMLAFACLAFTACAPAADEAPAGESMGAVLPEGAEALSLLGEPLVPPAPSAAARERLEANLAAARAAFEHTPEDADSIIWLGRRLAYLGRYREAIATYTSGIELHPDEARLYRHRGHRYITIREFDSAIADLARAAELTRGLPDEVEEDGAPNPSNIPTSTLQSNTWYHLALAHYLQHDFEAALPAWLECMKVSKNDDMLVATSDWLYMTYRRLGRNDAAERVLEPIHAGMTILENEAYHRRLLMYKHEIAPDSLLSVTSDDPVQIATYGYGVANWYLYNGDRDRAFEIFGRVLEGPNWAAFGFIAAEAEVASQKTTVTTLP